MGLLEQKMENGENGGTCLEVFAFKLNSFEDINQSQKPLFKK